MKRTGLWIDDEPFIDFRDFIDIQDGNIYDLNKSSMLAKDKNADSCSG